MRASAADRVINNRGNESNTVPPTDQLLAAGNRQAQLDGVRAIAIGLVVAQHLGFDPRAAELFSWWIPGPMGVRLFFVLSGFLITRILLTARASVESSAVSTTGAWLTFYIRRALRIFPLAYLALTLGVALHLSLKPWWYLGYLGNFYESKVNHFDGLGHFWSLAVEEQFYLVWPLFVFLAPRRLLLPLMTAVVLVAGISRWTYVAEGRFLSAYVLPWTRMDALAAGSVIAIVGATAKLSRRLVAAAAFLLLSAGFLAIGGAWAMIEEWGAIALCGALVSRAATGYKGRAGRFLSSRPVVFLAGISYGLYVWQPFFTTPAFGLADAIDPSGGHEPWLRHALGGLAVLVAIGVATLSQKYFERPFNSLKRFVPYAQPKNPPDTRLWVT